MKKLMIIGPLLILSSFLCFASDYILPPPNTKSLIQDISIKRNEKNLLIVEGKALLPEKTKIDITVFYGKKVLIYGSSFSGSSEESAPTTVGAKGVFNAGPFIFGKSLPKEGKYKIEVMSHFNGSWQTADVLEKVGDEGTKLPLRCLVPDDPEFPKNGGYIKFSTVATLSPLPQNIKAIEAVKSAKLYVSGQGQATDTIAEIVEYWNKPKTGFIAKGWSAKQQNKISKWIVSLNSQWGDKIQDAQWEYDATTGKVKYLNQEAKTLSWLPAE